MSRVTFTVNQDVTEEDPKTQSGSAESRRLIQSVSAPASTLVLVLVCVCVCVTSAGMKGVGPGLIPLTNKQHAHVFE